jgi:hypothetical protein
VKTLHERCPNVVVTRRRIGRTTSLVLEHEGGKGIVRKDNKFALFSADGDALKSGSTRLSETRSRRPRLAIRSDWRESGIRALTPPG